MSDTNTNPVTNAAHDNSVALFGNTDKWSVDYALSITSIEAARDYAKSAKAEDAKGRKYGTQATIAAGLATSRAIATGFIFDGRKDKPEGTVNKGEYGAMFGYASGAIVSKWITVGNLLTRCGIDPFATYYVPNTDQVFDLWNVLLNKSGLSKVGDLAEKGATVDEIIVETLKHFDADGTRKRPAAPQQTADEKKAAEAAAEKEKAEAEEAAKRTRPETVVLTLMAVRDTVKSFEEGEMKADAAGVARDLLAEIAALLPEAEVKPARKRTRKTA